MPKEQHIITGGNWAVTPSPHSRIRSGKVHFENDDHQFECTLYGRLWNGWECPAFLPDQMPAVVDWMIRGGYQAWFEDKDGDQRYCFLNQADDDPDAVIYFNSLFIDGTQYFDGGGILCWDEVEADE